VRSRRRSPRRSPAQQAFHGPALRRTSESRPSGNPMLPLPSKREGSGELRVRISCFLTRRSIRHSTESSREFRDSEASGRQIWQAKNDEPLPRCGEPPARVHGTFESPASRLAGVGNPDWRIPKRISHPMLYLGDELAPDGCMASGALFFEPRIETLFEAWIGRPSFHTPFGPVAIGRPAFNIEWEWRRRNLESWS
jgi:hypothetical protein